MGFRCLFGEVNSSNSKLRKWWTGMWNLGIPPKVKVFLWRLFHDAIPTGVNLIRRNIPINLMCNSCLKYEETSMHVFVTCNYAEYVWRNEACWDPIQLLQYGCIADFLVAVFTKLSKEEFCLFSLILWCLWNERNSFLHGGPRKDPVTLLDFAKNYLGEFQSAKRVEHIEAVPTSKIPSKW